MKEIISKKVESVEREKYGYNQMEKLDFIEEEIIKEFDEDHKRYKAIVREILETWEKSTNNDFLLYIETLRVLDLLQTTSGKDNFVFKIPRDKIKYIPSPESITRARRSLNAVGVGLPTNLEVMKRRMKRHKALQKYFREMK